MVGVWRLHTDFGVVTGKMGENRLIRGDCLDVMRRLDAESVALIYADPPHLSQNEYRGSSGWRKDGEEFFSDKWRWGEECAEVLERFVEEAASPIKHATEALYGLYGKSAETAYALFLLERLIQMRIILDKRGSLFLHLGLNVAHIGRILLDAVFGSRRMRNAIIWHKSGGGRARTRFSHKYDVVFWYTKTGRWRFNADAVRVPYKKGSGYAKDGIVSKSGKRYLPDPKGSIPDDVWYIPMVNPLSKERRGYPTQKPERLVERLVLAASDEGDVVCDPFCGSGTALVVAARNGRRFIGIDRNPKALEVSAERLQKEAPKVTFDIEGVSSGTSSVGGVDVRIRLFSRKQCPNCIVAKEMLSKFVENQKLQGLVKVEHYDLDTVDGLAEGAYWDVISVPTTIVIRGDDVVARWDGVVPKEEEIEKVIR